MKKSILGGALAKFTVNGLSATGPNKRRDDVRAHRRVQGLLLDECAKTIVKGLGFTLSEKYAPYDASFVGEDGKTTFVDFKLVGDPVVSQYAGLVLNLHFSHNEFMFAKDNDLTFIVYRQVGDSDEVEQLLTFKFSDAREQGLIQLNTHEQDIWWSVNLFEIDVAIIPVIFPSTLEQLQKTDGKFRTKYSPMYYGEIFECTKYAKDKLRENGFDPYEQVNLVLGHLVQFTHDERFEKAGWAFTPGPMLATYDRYCGVLQDDKVATFNTEDGKVSRTHSVTAQEYIHWNNVVDRDGQDVIIHSFEFIEPTHTLIQYNGAISWKALRGFVKPGKKSYFFDRATAVKFNCPV